MPWIYSLPCVCLSLVAAIKMIVMHLEYRRLSEALYQGHTTTTQPQELSSPATALLEMRSPPSANGDLLKLPPPSFLGTTDSSQDELTVTNITDASSSFFMTEEVGTPNRPYTYGGPSLPVLRGPPLPSVVTDPVFTGKSPDLGAGQFENRAQGHPYSANMDARAPPVTSILSGIWRLLLFQAFVILFRCTTHELR